MRQPSGLPSLAAWWWSQQRSSSAASPAASAAAPRPGRRKTGVKENPLPLDPAVEAFLRGKGVDTAALAGALPRSAAELAVGSAQAAWQLLEEGYGVPDLPALLHKAPGWLCADVEGSLRPKLRLLASAGLWGEPLGRLLGAQQNLVHTDAQQLGALLPRLQHYIGAAATAGLLALGADLRGELQKQPTQWGDVLRCSAGKVDAACAALQRSLGMAEAEFGAVLAGESAPLCGCKLLWPLWRTPMRAVLVQTC